MGSFVASLLISIDGYDANTDFTPTAEDHQVFNDLLARTSGIVIDRENHAILVPYWDDVALDDPDLDPAEREFAALFRTRPRHVVADTIDSPDALATLIDSDPVARLTALRAHSSGDLMIAAGPDLLATLLDADLIDEMEMLILPIVAGSGPRGIGDLARKRGLVLLETRALPSGAVFLHYRFAR